MKLKLLYPFKSISDFESEELPNFCIITGKNGGGKTQLLHLISESQAASSVFSISPEIKSIQSEGLTAYKKMGNVMASWRNLAHSYARNFADLHPTFKELLDYIYIHGIDTQKIDPNIPINETYKYRKILTGIIVHFRVNRQWHFEFTDFDYPAMQKFIIEEYFINSDFNKHILEVAKMIGKSPSKLSDYDIIETPVNEMILEGKGLFEASIESVIWGYVKRYNLNKKNYAFKKTYGYDYNSVTPEEFIAKNPKPWEEINKSLKTINLQLKIKEDYLNINEDENSVQFKFLRANASQEISYEELSSGEKVIIGLIQLVFLSNSYVSNLGLPDLLILDEPDATLHPEMTQTLLKLLRDDFVINKGIKVIMTTHSPSTVALAPEDAIFELKNGPNTSLKKIKKDAALKILTAGIPTLNIDYKNHKQIFVESPTDRYYYGAIFSKCFSEDPIGLPNMYFIALAHGKGNCQTVKDLTKEIREAGNETSFGIIDWDNKNSDVENNLFVHGKNARYSIENFIFDPIYLLVLMAVNEMYDANEILGVNKQTDIYQFIKSAEQDKLQNIADAFFIKIDETFKGWDLTEKIPCNYLNNISIRLPKQWIEKRGHDLTSKLSKKYDLHAKFSRKFELEEKLTDVAARLYPFVPKETVDLFKAIAAHS